MKFKNAYSPSKKVGYSCIGPSLTDQSFKQECDIGFIIENYAKMGKSFDNTNLNYYDCTTVQDFQNAQMIVAECKSNFEQLPSVERDRFKTVENYLEFISNKANLKECYEKGYIDRSSVDIEDVYPERYKYKSFAPSQVESSDVVSTDDKTVPPETPQQVG